MSRIQNIAIIGSGNSANFLANLFYSKGFKISTVISRNEASGRLLADKVNTTFSQSYHIDPDTDLVMICVPDNQIAGCAEQLTNTDAMVCHCAGSIAMNVLSGIRNHGVIYPLQSLSGQVNGIPEVPFLIEAGSDTGLKQLKDLMTGLGNSCTEVDSENRLHYHLAAVFANNFTNAMLMATMELTGKYQLDYTLLKPLIAQTFEKLKTNSPVEAQTGPAKRKDSITLEKHMQLLKNDPALMEVYEVISRYISEKFNR